MPTKTKLKFNLVSVIHTIINFPELINEFKKFGYHTDDTFRHPLLLMAEMPNNGAGKFRIPLIRIFRDNIEPDKEYLEFYLSQEEKTKRQPKEFSFKIVGSGTKEQIVDELQSWIYSIKGSTLEELRDGLNIEETSSTLTTNLPERYEG